MIFNSIAFLIFAPIFMVLYYWTCGRLRLTVCLVASYIFYGWWDWRFLSLLITSTIVDYFVAILLMSCQSQRRRNFLLFASIAFNLGLLGTFKYYNFFVDSLVSSLHQLGLSCHFQTLHIILPVGISFYTFQTMSYTIDVYRRQLDAEPSFLRFATYVAFFPQLVAGPIVRAASFLPQLQVDQCFKWNRFISGLLLIFWGFLLKAGIADSLAQVVDICFAHPEANSSSSLLVGVIFYAFQIYCDFCGYSNIAIGLARIMGFEFGINFDRPYFSASFSEFWTRWHISLSSWLRDYLYIPLGGNRSGTYRTYRNLMLTMLLGGLWHGAAWKFVFWGGLHGLYLVLQRLTGPLYDKFVRLCRVPTTISRIFLIGLVFLLTCIAWIFFRAENLGDAFYILQQIGRLDALDFASVAGKFYVVKGLFLIAFLLLIEIISTRFNLLSFFVRKPLAGVLAAAAMLWGLTLFGTFSQNAFIYFQF